MSAFPSASTTPPGSVTTLSHGRRGADRSSRRHPRRHRRVQQRSRAGRRRPPADVRSLHAGAHARRLARSSTAASAAFTTFNSPAVAKRSPPPSGRSTPPFQVATMPSSPSPPSWRPSRTEPSKPESIALGVFGLIAGARHAADRRPGHRPVSCGVTPRISTSSGPSAQTGDHDERPGCSSAPLAAVVVGTAARRRRRRRALAARPDRSGPRRLPTPGVRRSTGPSSGSGSPCFSSGSAPSPSSRRTDRLPTGRSSGAATARRCGSASSLRPPRRACRHRPWRAFASPSNRAGADRRAGALGLFGTVLAVIVVVATVTFGAGCTRSSPTRRSTGGTGPTRSRPETGPDVPATSDRVAQPGFRVAGWSGATIITPRSTARPSRSSSSVPWRR